MTVDEKISQLTDGGSPLPSDEGVVNRAGINYRVENIASIPGIQQDSYIYANDTGVANAYTANLSPAITSYVAGLQVVIKIANANTGASTLTLNSLTTKGIKNLDGTALSAGDLGVGQLAIFVFDGTNFQLINALVTGGGNGDVIGPSSAVNGNFALYNGVTGKVIKDGGLVPGTLATANTTNILNNSYIYANDTGVANAYVAVLSPAAVSYVAGMQVVVKIANANTGASTLALNALSAQPIKNLDGTALGAGDLAAGQEAIFVFDGTNFQLINALVTGAGNGDVIGPSSAVNGNFALYNGTTGKVIKDGGLVPGTLATANTTNILNNSYIYVADSGIANAYVAVLSPAAAAYVAGMQVVVKIANANTGASTLALNALSAQPIVNLDGSALSAGDLGAAQEAIFVYDGSHFQLINALVTGAGNGDVIGPLSATSTALARYNGTSGKIIENSAVLLDNSGNMTGVNSLSATRFVVPAETLVYVNANTGSDTGDGSVLYPYQTIGFANSAITDNSAAKPYCIIFAGITSEATMVLKPWVSIRGLEGNSITITGGSVTLDTSWSSVSGGSVAISNLNFSSTNLTFTALGTGSNPATIYVYNCVATNCNFTGRAAVVDTFICNNYTVNTCQLVNCNFKIYNSTLNIPQISSPSATAARTGLFAGCIFTGTPTVGCASGNGMTVTCVYSNLQSSVGLTDATTLFKYDAISYPASGFSISAGATAASVGSIQGVPIGSTITSSGAFTSLAASGLTTLSGGRIDKVTHITTTTYTALATDYILSCDSASFLNITLISSPATGRVYRIKDISGAANINPITITPAGGGIIDGQPNYVINSAYGSIDIFYNGVGWSIV